VISDLPESLSDEESPASHNLREFISSCPSLQSLSLDFEVLGVVPMTFLEPVSSLNSGTQTSTLHSLTLSNVSSKDILSFSQDISRASKDCQKSVQLFVCQSYI
jgi:hypothetical protein